MRHGKLLTQDEVDAIPEGTKVVITWSGGNGPFEYTIEKVRGFAWAKECGCWINFVGEYPLTQVSLLERAEEEV